jgi:hypothetical protein
MKTNSMLKTLILLATFVLAAIAVPFFITSINCADDNLAYGIVPTGSATFYGGPASNITDGITDSGSVSVGGAGPQWIMIDLGYAYDLTGVKIWHFYSDGRIYHDVIVQLCNTPYFDSGVTTVFNNDNDNSAGQGAGSDLEYVETSQGKEITFNSIAARYVRLWTNGNTVNEYSHYREVEIYGSGTPPTPTPTPVGSTVYWLSDHEEGDLSDWWVNQEDEAVFNNNNGETTTVTDEAAHTGRQSIKMWASGMTDDVRACRIFRWDEELTEGFYSAWLMFPELPDVNGWLNIFQVKKKASEEQIDPTYYHVLRSGPQGETYLTLDRYDEAWNINPLPGVQRPELHENEWFHIEWFYKSGTGQYDGELVIWVNGTKIWHLVNVDTLGIDSKIQWAPSMYGDQVGPPDPLVMYVDDCAISDFKLGTGYFTDGTVRLDNGYDTETTGNPPSGWILSGSGGTCTIAEVPDAENKSMKLQDTSSSGRIEARKNLTSSTGVITAEFETMFGGSLLNGGSVILREGTTDAVRIFANSQGQLVYKDDTGSDITIDDIAADAWYKIRIMADTNSDICDVYLDGTRKLSGVPFRFKVDAVDNVFVITSNSSTGTMYVDNIKVSESDTARTVILREKYEGQTVDSEPDDWTVSGSGGTVTVVNEPGTANKCIRVNDTSSSQNIAAVRSISSVGGEIQLECRIKQSSYMDAFKICLRSGTTDAVAVLSKSDGNLYYINSQGVQTLLGHFDNNQWVKLTIKANPSTDKCSIYVDDFILKKNVDFRNAVSSIDNILFVTNPASTGVTLVDDVIVTLP